MDSLLSIEPGLAIYTVVSFLLFLLLLRRFAWTPILKALERRERRITEAIESAEKAKEDAERIVSEHKEALAEARQEARGLISKAAAEADRKGEEMVLRARKEAEALIERARAEIKSEEADAIKRVRREAVDIALEAASKLLERSLGDEDHRRLVERFIRETEEQAGGRGS